MDSNRARKWLTSLLVWVVCMAAIDCGHPAPENHPAASNLDFVECVQPRYNKYDDHVVVLFVADKDGLAMPKSLYHANKNTSLHGIWPKGRCYQEGQKVKYVYDFMTSKIDSLRTDYLKLREWVVRESIATKWMSSSPDRYTFYQNEYKRHFFDEGYSVNYFIASVRSYLHNLDYNEFEVHECLHDKRNNLNRIQQLVRQIDNKPLIGQKNNCKENENTKYFLNENEVTLPTRISATMQYQSMYNNHFEINLKALRQQLLKLKNYFGDIEFDFESITQTVTTILLAFITIAGSYYKKVKKDTEAFIQTIKIFNVERKFTIQKNLLLCIAIGLLTILVIGLAGYNKYVWIFSAIINLVHLIYNLIGSNSRYGIGYYFTQFVMLVALLAAIYSDTIIVSETEWLDYLKNYYIKKIAPWYFLYSVVVSVMVKCLKTYHRAITAEQYNEEKTLKKITSLLDGLSFGFVFCLIKYILVQTLIIFEMHEIVPDLKIVNDTTRQNFMLLCYMSLINEAVNLIPVTGMNINLLGLFSSTLFASINGPELIEFTKLLQKTFFYYEYGYYTSLPIQFFVLFLILIIFKYTCMYLNVWLVFAEVVTTIPLFHFFKDLPFFGLEGNLTLLLNHFELQEWTWVLPVVMSVFLVCDFNRQIISTPRHYFKIEQGKFLMKGTLKRTVGKIFNSIMRIFTFLALLTCITKIVLTLAVQAEPHGIQHGSTLAIISFAIMIVFEIYHKVILIKQLWLIHTEEYVLSINTMVYFYAIYIVGLTMALGGFLYWITFGYNDLAQVYSIAMSVAPYIVGDLMLRTFLGLCLPIFQKAKSVTFIMELSDSRVIYKFIDSIKTLYSWSITSSHIIMLFSFGVKLWEGAKMSYITYYRAEYYVSLGNLCMIVCIFIIVLEKTIGMGSKMSEWFFGELELDVEYIYERKGENVKEIEERCQRGFLTDAVWNELVRHDMGDHVKNKATTGNNGNATQRHFTVGNNREILSKIIRSDQAENRSTEEQIERIPLFRQTDFGRYSTVAPFTLTGKRYVLRSETSAPCYLPKEFTDNKKLWIENNQIYAPGVAEIETRCKLEKTAKSLQGYGANDPNHMVTLGSAPSKIESIINTLGPYCTNKIVYYREPLNLMLKNFISPNIIPDSVLVTSVHSLLNLSSTMSNSFKIDYLVPESVLLAQNSKARGKEEENDILTLSEYMRLSNVDYNHILEKVKSKQLNIVVSSKGKLFVVPTETQVGLLLQRNWESYDGENQFDRFNWYELEEDKYVRPSRIDALMTLSTTHTLNGLRFKLPKGTQCLQASMFSMLLHAPMEKLDLVKTQSVYANPDQEKWVNGILAMSVGKIYIEDEISKANIGYVGSCSIVRDDSGKLRVITNKHVVRGYGAFTYLDINGKKTLFSFQGDLQARFSLLGNRVCVKLNNLISVGEDYAMFSISDEILKKFENCLLPIGINSATPKFPSFAKENLKSGGYLHMTRQTDNALDDEMDKIMIFNVILQWDDYKNYFNVLGYTTQGMSGSPIFDIGQDGIRLVGLCSAVENFNGNQVHMTRIVDGNKIRLSHNKYLSNKQHNMNENCLIPCMTETFGQGYEQVYNINFCNIDMDMAWRQEGIWPKLVKNVLVCKSKEDRMKEYYFWKIYEEDPLVNETGIHMTEEIPIGVFAARPKLPPSNKNKFFNIDLGGQGFFLSEVSSILDGIKRNTTFDGVSFSYHGSPNLHVFTFDDNNWYYEVKNDVDPIEGKILVDEGFIYSFFASCSGEYNYSLLFKKMLNTRTVDRILTCHNADGKLFFETYGLDQELCNIEKIEMYALVQDGETVPIDKETYDAIQKDANQDELKKLYNRVKNLKEVKRELVRNVQQKRKQITDIRQSYEFLEKAKEYQEVMDKFKEQVEEYNKAKKNIEPLLQELREQKKGIELKYLDMIKNKKIEKKQIAEELEQVRAEKKEESRVMFKSLDERIVSIKKKIDDLKQELQKIQVEKTEKINNTKLHQKEKEIQEKLKNKTAEIQDLMAEKIKETSQVQKKIEEQRVEIPNKPEIVNPELDPKLDELRKQVANQRQQIRNIDKTIEEIQDTIKQMTEQVLKTASLEAYHFVMTELMKISKYVVSVTEGVGDVSTQYCDSIKSTALNMIAFIERMANEITEESKRKKKEKLDREINEDKQKERKPHDEDYDEDKYKYQKTTKRPKNKKTEDEKKQEEKPKNKKIPKEGEYETKVAPSTSWADQVEDELGNVTTTFIPASIDLNIPQPKFITAQKKEKPQMFVDHKKLIEVIYEDKRSADIIEKLVLEKFKRMIKGLSKGLSESTMSWATEDVVYSVKFQKDSQDILREFLGEICKKLPKLEYLERDINNLSEKKEKKYLSDFIGTSRYIKLAITKRQDENFKQIFTAAFATEDIEDVSKKIQEGIKVSPIMKKNSFKIFDKSEVWPKWFKSAMDYYLTQQNKPVFLDGLDSIDVNNKYVVILQTNETLGNLIHHHEDQCDFLYNIPPRRQVT